MPISLIGSLYKILSKLLAARLQKVIHCVISDTQSAFIKGRQILDGLLIANQMVDEAKTKERGSIIQVQF